MPWSHLHVKQSRETHALSRFLRNGIGLGFSWKLGGLIGNYEMYVASGNCPSLKEQRKTIFTKLSGAWLSHGSCGVYVAVTGSEWQLLGLRPALFRKNRLA